jgi:Dolichyl-phosphate-mannose-protein mannosyltransferase
VTSSNVVNEQEAVPPNPLERRAGFSLSAKPSSVILALPGILLAALCLVPFLGKGYTIDDPLFLLAARQILKTPLQPWSYPLCWNGTFTCFVQAGTSGANVRQGLMGYVLVPVILANGAEWVAHLIQLMLLCIGVFEMVRLGRRLGLDPAKACFAGLLLVAIPPVLSMANTTMPDILALTVGLTGMERLLAWKEEKRWSQGLAAGLALGLAPYARPHAALLLPLAAVWLFDSFRPTEALSQFRRQSRLWIPLLLAAGVFAGVSFLTRLRGAPSDLAGPASALDNVTINLIAYFHYMALPIPFAAVWLATRWRIAKVLLVPPLIPIVFARLMLPGMTWARELQLAAVLYGGVAILDMLGVCLRKGERLGLLLALWMLLPLTAVMYLHFPLKYLVLVLPAVIFILLRAVAVWSSRHAMFAGIAVVAACAGYSAVLLRADLDFADYARRAAAELIRPRVAAGEKVWYGGEWGFYWYAEKAGAMVANPEGKGPRPGELIAVGLMEDGDVVLKHFPNRELVDSRSYDSPHGRTMGYGAGLYSNRFGLLPWRWNPHATNTYELWRIH